VDILNYLLPKSPCDLQDYLLEKTTIIVFKLNNKDKQTIF